MRWEVTQRYGYLHYRHRPVARDLLAILDPIFAPDYECFLESNPVERLIGEDTGHIGVTGVVLHTLPANSRIDLETSTTWDSD